MIEGDHGTYYYQHLTLSLSKWLNSGWQQQANKNPICSTRKDIYYRYILLVHTSTYTHVTQFRIKVREREDIVVVVVGVP